jgi:signal transduction histidine kinase
LISALKCVNKPFPGFLFYKNLVITDVSSSLSGEITLRRFSDIIIGVNGQKASSPDDIYRVVDRLPVGTLVDYQVSRNGNTIRLTIPIMQFTFGDFLSIFGTIYFVGLIFLIVGVSVYYLKPHLHSSKFFLLFCFSVGIWFVTSFDSQAVYLFDKLAFLGGLFSPAFALYLASIFFSNQLLRKTPRIIAFSLAFIFSSVLFVLNIAYYDSYSAWKYIIALVWLYIIFGSLALPISSFITYARPSSHLDRQKAQVILLGSLAGLFLPALGAVSIVVFRVNMPFNILALPVITFPISIAYAIVKHKLFDIDVIIQKALVYGVLTGALGGISALMIMVFNVAFANYGGWKNPAFFITLSVFLVTALNPLKNRIQNFIDLTFFRTKYDYRRTIEEISSAMTSLLNLDEITDKIIRTIQQTMFSHPVFIILFDQTSGDYRAYSKAKELPFTTVSSIKEDNELIKLFSRYRQEIFKDDLIADDRYIRYKNKLMRTFDDFSAALFVPILFKKRLIGILSLGEKKSGLSYNSQDMKLLRILANQSAIAIENALAFRLVEDYAKKLEEANREIRETQSQLIQIEKMSAIGQLAAGLAHEIRNPLNIIEGARYYLSQLIEGENSEVQKEYLEYIKHEIDRTNRMVDNLLKFSRSEPPHFESVNINSILENALVLIRKQLLDNKIRLITALHPQIPAVMGDPNQLWQVFINMLINAIQAMPRGGELKIDTGFYNGFSNNIYISFRDTGEGIEEEDLSKIFDPFFTRKETGTGLGLSISYKIVENHNGRIIVSSKKGEGATFVVELAVSQNIKGVEDGRDQKDLSG